MLRTAKPDFIAATASGLLATSLDGTHEQQSERVNYRRVLYVSKIARASDYVAARGGPGRGPAHVES